MKSKKTGLLLLLLFLLFSFGCKTETTKKEIPRAIKGVLDLRGWDLKKDGSVDLSGEWEFYWRQLLNPQQFKSTTNYIQVPSFWSGYSDGQKRLEGQGYMTYRLKILLNKNNLKTALKINKIYTSYSLYVNGQHQWDMGVPGKTRESTNPKFFPKLFFIDSPGDTLEILIQVANFAHSKGGITQILRFGESKAIITERENALARDTILFGSILIIAIYHFGLYLLRKVDPSPLYFGTFCLLIAIRTLVTNEIYLQSFFSDFSYGFQITIDLLTVYLCVPMMALFIHSLYSEEFSKKLLFWIQAICYFLAVVLIVTPINIGHQTLIPFELLSLLVMLLFIVVIVKAVIRNREDARILLFGLLALIATAVNDILFDNNIIQSVNNIQLLPLGLLITILSQSLVLSIRVARAYDNLESEIKERIITENKLKHANKQVEAAYEAKSDFLNNMSHELRTPLHHILGYSEVGLKKTKDKFEDLRHYFEIIDKSGNKLLTLVNAILELSHLEAEKLHYKMTKVDFIAHIRSIVQEFEAETLTKKLLIKVEDSTNHVMVACDLQRMIRVISNLLSNAITVSPEGGTITLSCGLNRNSTENGARNSFLLITIKDEGVGIPENEKEAIFEKFHQSSFTNTGAGGTGLGLTISEEIIKGHKGKIWAENNPEGGAKFSLTIPL